MPVRRRLVELLARLPLPLRTSSQLAREAILHGALQKPSEFGPLLALVRHLRPSVVVEIGSALGGSLHGLALASPPEATLCAVDLEPPPAVELRPQQRFVPVRGNSHEHRVRDELRRRVGGRPVDVLLIDGDHSYEGVRRDFELYVPLVRPGGIVALHDVLEHPQRPEYQVHRLWRELVGTYPETLEFVDPDADWGWGRWGGIGVVKVEPSRLGA